MHCVAVLNHKGGVGKTTFTGCTAQALALTGHRVLTIDNDSQHNLSTMLGVGLQRPSIRDVYLADSQAAPAEFLRAVRRTDVPGLHLICSHRDLCDEDVKDPMHLRRTIEACGLDRYYDVLLIDNAPGMDRLQGAAINACPDIFVPTELRQFAIDGIAEMETTLSERYPGGGRIRRIIPNFYRETKRHTSFIAALNTMFPGRVTVTAIPVDNVFDELITEGKTLFYHRLRSKAAAYYLKLMHELFDLDENDVWEKVTDRRNERIRGEARERLQRTRQGISDQEAS